ncbi:hypothetical protein IAT38_006523 [Cryptococcus sp. DSM 104549]
MSFVTHEAPTFGHYTANLREGLRQSAVKSLVELEETINSSGYDWLDGYMAQILNRVPQAPIADLLKTPSKTQTVKKTRAATAAAKERTEKVKGLNARLFSPTQQITRSRSPLSPMPLGGRSVNVSSAPPSPSPVKAKAAKPAAKPKAKRGRPVKTASVTDENAAPSSAPPSHGQEPASVAPRKKTDKADKSSSSSRSKSTRDGASDKASSSSRKEAKVEEEKERSKPSRKGKQAETAAPVEQEPMVAVDEAPQPEQEMEVDEPVEDVPIAAEALAPKSEEKDLSVVAEGEENSEAVAIPPPAEEIEEETSKVEEAAAEPVEEPTHAPAEEIKTEAAPEVLEAAGFEDIPLEEEVEPLPVDGALEATVEPVEEQLVAPTLPAAEQPESATSQAGAQSVYPSLPIATATTTSSSLPMRQVRSSWLSKALGTGSVPISGPSGATDTAAALRKSYAAPPQQRQSTAMDFSGLRKSLVPIGGLKRKSDQGMDEEAEDEEEEKRPEKIAKVAVESAQTHLPATTPGPVGRPAMQSKTPSFGTASISSHPATTGRPTNPSGSSMPTSGPDDTHRSEIYKVTRALDELREKKAKEAAAKKAAETRTASGEARVPMAKSTGVGFLRGLLRYGAAAEEEAEEERKAREEKEEKLAEEELEQLMAKKTTAEEEPEVVVDNAAEAQPEQVPMEVEPKEVVRSTTPVFSPPPKSVARAPVASPQMPSHPATTDDEDEEMVEDDSVLDEIVPEERTESMPVLAQRDLPQEPEESAVRTPPVHAVQEEPPALHARKEKHGHGVPAATRKEEREQEEAAEKSRKGKEREREREAEIEPEPESDATEIEEEEEDELDEEVHAPAQTNRKIPSATSSASTLNTSTMSTTSQATSNGMLSHAAMMAAKALGVKPAAAPVKSLQLAASAAKKEQAAANRQALRKDQIDQRKQLMAQKKAEEERIRAEEERKAKVAELEEKRRMRAEQEKRKKEREAKLAAAAKEKAAKEEREMQAARAAKIKQAEEDAARKRKLAAALSKSQTSSIPPAKRVAGPGSSHPQPVGKGKELFRPTKTGTHPLASSTSAQPKMGPTSFRTAETSQYQGQSHTSTVSLVKQQTQRDSQVERKPLGQPSRPSAMEQHHFQQQQPMRQSTSVPHLQPQQLLHQQQVWQQAQGSSMASSVLQQSRAALQTQLDEKAAMVQSEDIVLPDIASEYSDPDDEDRSRDFDRPAWAESPELARVLEAQSRINPDHLFEAIKPFNMDEVFKARVGKFRARTSSANWSSGDGLTRAEEIDYARRMGFSVSAYFDEPGGSGSGGH